MFFVSNVPFQHKIIVYNNYYHKIDTYSTIYITIYTSKSSLITKKHFNTHKSVHNNIYFLYLFSISLRFKFMLPYPGNVKILIP